MWGARVRMSVWVAGSVCTLVARACARQGPAHTRLGGRGALLGGHHGNSHLLPIPARLWAPNVSFFLFFGGGCVRAGWGDGSATPHECVRVRVWACRWG
jgi:hypothetical protein